MRYVFFMILCASIVAPVACSEAPEPTNEVDDAGAMDTTSDGGVLHDGDIDLRDGERAPFDADCLFCGEPI